MALLCAEGGTTLKNMDLVQELVCKYGVRMCIVPLQLASSWFGSAPQAQAASYSETPALYAPLLSLERTRRREGALFAFLCLLLQTIY